MAVFYQNSGSISDLVVSNRLAATGSLFGTASYVQNASFAQQMDINVSDSVSSNNVSQLVFSNSNNVSFGLDGSTITATAAGGGGVNETFSYFNPQDAYIQALGTFGNGSLVMQPMQLHNDVQFDSVAFPIYMSNAANANSSVGLTLSMRWGLYTRDVSTLNLLTDYTTLVSFQGTLSTANSSLYHGIRLWTAGITNTLTQGQYYAAVVSNQTTANVAGTISNIVASQQNSSFFGLFGQSYNRTIQYTRGLGFYSATTNDLPSSIAFNELFGAATATNNTTATIILRQPIFYVVSQTF